MNRHLMTMTKKRRLQNKINGIVSQIVTKLKPEIIILFGSAAWGHYTSDSDVDILIVKSNVPARGIDRQLYVDRLIERNGIPIDMLVYKPKEIEEGVHLGDPFIKEILKRGKRLYG